MSTIFDISDRYVEQLAGHDALVATMVGVPGHEEDMTDHSPAGVEAQIDLTAQTASELRRTEPEGDPDRVCRDFMIDRLELQLEEHRAGESWRLLRNFGSPVQNVRAIFDLCPQETAEDWAHVAVRLGKVPAAVRSLESALRHGLALGLPAARRQALVCARQAAVWGGLKGEGPPFFMALAARCAHDGRLSNDLEVGARAATEAYAGLSRFLRDEYAPAAPDQDPVGRERYLRAARYFLGATLNPEETYAWGWEELHRLEAEMQRVAERIRPGAGVEAAVELLNTDPERAIHGVDNLQRFLQELTDTAIAELNGAHFDIPEQMRRCECMIAPPGGAAAMYYTPPSEDWSRPGRTWYPTLGRTVFPIWTEVTTAYHEGVPGHHLQIGLMNGLAEELSRFQRTVGFVSGQAEGWALYGERLMGELGYLENPDYEFGMLSAHIFRAMRVIVDIGLHLELAVPAGEENAGQRWSWDLALAFANKYSPHRGEFTRSEVERYLGMPAQAISYKVGEKQWLDMRDEVKQRQGAGFDLKAFHNRALRFGSLGLDQLRREMLATG